LQSDPYPANVHSLPTGDVPIHRCCRECGIILHALLRWKVRTPEPGPRPHCRLHDLLQHGRLLLCGKDLANWAGGWDEYNSGLYSVPNRNVFATHPNRQHSLHALLRRKVRPHDWSALCRLHDILQLCGVLLCDKGLAHGTGDWDEYNGGLYTVRR